MRETVYLGHLTNPKHLNEVILDVVTNQDIITIKSDQGSFEFDVAAIVPLSVLKRLREIDGVENETPVG